VNTPGVGDHARKRVGKLRRWHLRLSRDVVIFGIGIIGILHEIFWSTSDRPTLIILFAAMIGLPAFLRIDERGRGDDDK
jgi:predicted membrane channel-forming protein YqfA (hemolysin III family)